MNLISVISGKIPGYENIWFIGNSFMVRSFRQYFQDREQESYRGYIKKHFQTSGYMSDKYISNNPNMTGRIQNCLVKVIHDQLLLPKMIVIVLDDDIIHFINHAGQEL